MATPIVAVINMKGGVGKTIISANVFREVFRTQGKNTLLIDFDPQHNLSQLLLTRVRYEGLRSQQRTLWHVLNPDGTPSVFNISDSDLISPGPVDSYVHRLRTVRRPEVIQLDLLLGDFRTASINLMTDTSALSLRRQRFLSFVKKCQEIYDFIVLDCNPSSSFMTRAAIEAATHLLIPVRADRYSILGLEMVTDYVRDLPTLDRPPESLIIINDLPTSGGQLDVIDELRSHPEYGPRTLTTMLRHSKILEARADYTGFAVDRRVAYSNTVRRRLREVADEIAARM